MPILIPKMDKKDHVRTWFKLTGGEVYKNIGLQAEVGYSKDEDEPEGLSGEVVDQGELIDTERGTPYILQTGYTSFEFLIVEESESESVELIY